MDKRGQRIFLRGMSTRSPMVVSNRRMESFFRHSDITWVAECMITTQDSSQGNRPYHVDIRKVLAKNETVFGPLPIGRPSERGFEHVIDLEEGAKPVITIPYRHPKKFKDKIKKAI